MKLHPRHHVYREAEIEFLKFWVDFLEKHDLTSIEFLNILSAQQQSMLKLTLKGEWKEAKREHRGPNGE